MELQNLSANWKKLQSQLQKEPKSSPTAQQNGLKRKRDPPPVETKSSPSSRSLSGRRPRIDKRMGSEGQKNLVNTVGRLEMVDSGRRPRFEQKSANDKENAGLSEDIQVGQYVAIDCEMVGVGPNPDDESALARVSIVNYDGDQVYDSFVKPMEKVTDYRTHVSGVAEKHMIHARSFHEVQQEVSKIIDGKVVIGHSIRNDFNALLLSHPRRDIRDTARHPPYRKLAGGSSPRLKILASELLGVDIQGGEHSSVEDARACMLLFRRDKAAFEREHMKKWGSKTVSQSTNEAETTSNYSKKSKKKKKR